MRLDRTTILDIIGDASKSKVNIGLSNNVGFNLDDKSEQEVSKLILSVNSVCDKSMSEAEQFLDETIDSFSQDTATGQDFAEVLMVIERYLLDIEQTFSDIKTEYELVELAYKDKYNAFYTELLEGTVGDRTSYAESKTIKERYASFVRKTLMEHFSIRLERIKSCKRTFEKGLWNGIRSNE